MAEGSKTQKKFRTRVVEFLEKYTIHWYAITAILYFTMIPLSIWVFPNTTLFVTIIVLFSGFTASVASLASTLIDLKQNDEIDDLQDDVADLDDDGVNNDSFRG